MWNITDDGGIMKSAKGENHSGIVEGGVNHSKFDNRKLRSFP